MGFRNPIKIFLLISCISSLFLLTSTKGCNKTIRTSRLVRSPRVTSAIKGKPLYCVYRIFKYTDSDKVFELNFKAFQIGRLTNSSTCERGHLKIIDSRLRASSSGLFCGKLRSSRLFISETDAVTLMLYVENYTKQSFFRVQSSVLPKRLAQERHKDLAVKSPGHLLEGTYCDRVFLNCEGFCDVLSPGYPGFYPRNVTCRYHIMFNESDVSVVIGNNYYDVFDVGLGSSGSCDHKFCSSPITNQCPSDYLQIEERTEFGNEVIGRFCGKGHLPRIVSKSNELILEFVSSTAGTMQNDGFYLSVGYESRSKKLGQELLKSKQCQWSVNSRDKVQGQVHSLKHWYPPNTRCFYKFVGRYEEKIWIQFISFSAHHDCNNQLLIYNSQEPFKQSLLGTYCKRNRPNETFLSMGPELLIEFFSKTGSYDGSHFEFSMLYLFVNTTTSGNHVRGSICDEIFDSENNTKGNFHLLRNRLLLRRHHLHCRFVFEGRIGEQIRFVFDEIRFNPSRQCEGNEFGECNQDDIQDHIVIYDQRNTVVKCICATVLTPLEVTIVEPYVEIRLNLFNIHPFAYRQTNTYVFKGYFEFLQLGCGPNQMNGLQGTLTYPSVPQRFVDEVFCRWKIKTPVKTHIFIKFQYSLFNGNCSSENIRLYIGKETEPYEELCGDRLESELLPPTWSSKEPTVSHEITVELKTIFPSTRFKLLWNAVSRANESIYNEHCGYLCPDFTTCIPKELVCNGIINCPQANYIGEPLDESVQLCSNWQILIIWFITVAVISVITVFAVAFMAVSYHKIISLCKCVTSPLSR